MYLRIELELHLKTYCRRFDKIFEIGKSSEMKVWIQDIIRIHLMELYEAYADMYTMMERAEKISLYSGQCLRYRKIDYQGQIINEAPWRLTMIEAQRIFGCGFDSSHWMMPPQGQLQRSIMCVLKSIGTGE